MRAILAFARMLATWFFPAATPWIAGQLFPIALGLMAVLGIGGAWWASHAIEARRIEHRIETRAEEVCREHELAAEAASLRRASVAKDRIIAHRARALSAAETTASNLAEELRSTREKLATSEDRNRYCIPPDDEWLRGWQRRSPARGREGSGKRPVPGT